MNSASISEALRRLVPGAEFTVDGDTLDDITWLDSTLLQPDDTATEAEADAVEAELAAAAYLNHRGTAYGARGADLATMVEALWQHVMESDSTLANSVQTIRDQVHAEFPVPEQNP